MIHQIMLRRLLLALLLFCSAACQVQNSLSAPTPTSPAPTETARPTAEVEPAPGSPVSFDTFLQQLEEVPIRQRQINVDRYVAQLGETPITDEGRAFFLWRGEALTVKLIGDMNNWNPDESHALTRIAGSDLWYFDGSFEPDARLDYQFVIDGEERRLDPLNPRVIRSKDGPNSELVMPDYEKPPELDSAEKAATAGTLAAHTIESAYLNQTRTFFVYVPAGQLVGEKLPSVYVNNGSDFLNLIETPDILDQLIAQRQIPPLVTVFIPPINPGEEYLLNDDYVNFMTDELVPYVRESYGTDPDPAKTGTIGVSMGGLAAVYTAAARPDTFGLAASLSGTFTNNQRQRLVQKLARAPGDIRLYHTVGIYETAVVNDSATNNLLEANRQLADSLARYDYDYRYEERPEGHSWGFWQSALGRALRFFYSAE